MRPLRDVKSTNYYWLGDIPSTWKLPKTAWHFKIGMGETILGESLVEKGIPVYSATEKDHFFGYVSKANLHLEKGDLVVPARGNSIGHVKIVSQLSTTTQTTIYLKKLSDLFESKFVYWFMKGFKGDLFPFVQTAIPQLTVDEVSKNPIVQPPLYEQRQIAAYLNRETAKIDKLIAKQQKLIKLLQEKRQAVISQAVTKGLDPNVKMKDSGVEWLGEVPEHWTVSDLNHVLAALGDIDHYMPETVDDGVPYVMTGDLKERASEICFEDCKKVSRFDYEKLSRRIRTSSGDVVMARYATIGTVTYVDIEKELLISYSCVTIKPNLNVLIGKFLFFFLRSTVFQSAIKNIVNTNTQANVGIGDLKKVKIALPTIIEQKQIVDFVEGALADLSNLMDKAIRSVSLLKEHRQALITAAVTGKIDVRGLVSDEEVAALDAEPEVETTEEDFASDVVEDTYITEEE